VRSDLIEIFKIMNGMYDINCDVFFQLDEVIEDVITLLRQCNSVCLCVCVVVAVLTYDSRRMISLYKSKLEFSLMTAVRFVYIAVDFHIRK